MGLTVVISPAAGRQIRDAAKWWLENRPLAPGAIQSDLQAALDLLAIHPNVGAKCADPKLQEVRRLFLSRVQYFVYYQSTDKQLRVLAFWHASRQEEPSVVKT